MSVQHGRVLALSADDPLVTVEAGNVQVHGGVLFARYVVDRATQTCWLIVGGGLAPLACCDARRVAALREVIAWEDDASCARPAAVVSHSIEATAPEATVRVALDGAGQLYLDDGPVAMAELEARARRLVAERGPVRATIAADASRSHAEVVRVMDALRSAGVTRVAVAVAPEP